jgi:hypothetical protein
MSVQPPNPELAALPDLFLLHPQNRAFVNGEGQPHLENGGWGCILLVTAFSSLVFTLVAAFLPDGFQYLIVIPVLLWLATFWCLWELRRAQHLARHGRLLKGELLSYQLGQIPDEEGYPVKLHYSFATPNGQLREVKTRSAVSEYQRHQPLPRTGVPLAVLCVDDRLYEIL